MLRLWTLPWFILSLFLGSILSLKSQQVYWKKPTNALSERETTTLELVFEDCQPDDTPDLPQVNGLNFGTPSSSTQYSMENFKISQRGVLSYPIQATQQGTLTIPAFEVNTSEGPLTVEALTLQVGATSTPSSRPNSSLDQIVFSRINANKKSVWLGEVFTLDYLLLLSPNYNAQLSGTLQWSPVGLALEDWTQPSQVQAQVSGEMRQGIQQVAHACALKSGVLNFSPAEQKLNIQTGTQRFGFFSRPKMEQFTVQSQPFTLEVKELPPKPHDFFDAVGQFQLTSKIVPRSVTVGEPITWTLELAGTGNWPAELTLPAREVSSDFRAIEPKSKLVKPDGKPFEGTLTEDVILIPTKPGHYTLGPLSYSYFDPERSTYINLTTEPVEIEVKPSNANAFAVNPPNSLEENLENQPSSEAAPSLLPRDPIEKNEAQGWVPQPSHFFYFAASPLLAFFACWITLAFRRSCLTDPNAPRKQAKSQLQLLLKHFSTHSHEEINQQLMSWRHHTAQLLNITHATPTAEEVHKKISSLYNFEIAETWRQLWQQTDSYLFSQQNRLSTEWQQQARQALNPINLPRQSFWRLFLPKNLLPAFIFFFFLGSSLVHAQNETDALNDYNQGDFKKAENQLTTQWNQNPNNWAVRNNLALALAQQERWPEATSHWIAGRLLNPRETSIAWNLPLGLQHSEFVDSPQLNFLNSHSFFLLASPAEWQWLFLLGIFAFTLSLILLIFRRYRLTQNQSFFINRWIIYFLLFLSLGTGSLAWFGWKNYDILANPNAALIWQTAQLHSIPTDVDEQTSHEISSGTLVIVKKSFLNWLKVELTNQENGWIRRDSLISLYQSPTSFSVKK
ncbi:MAG: BatD family protein [Verrucomicrobiae bacterium]|nr:BatD family protein [Verrucomicrobiae bacterium]